MIRMVITMMLALALMQGASAKDNTDIKDAYNGFETWVRDEQPFEWWKSHMSDILTDLDLSNNP